jgi:nitroreductase
MGHPLDEAGLDTIFRTARSYNGYLDKPVTQDDIHRIYDLVKWGPTSANQHPARFVWVTTPEAKETLAALTTGANPDKVRKAPASVIVAMTSISTSSCPGCSRMRRTRRTGSPTKPPATPMRSATRRCRAPIC